MIYVLDFISLDFLSPYHQKNIKKLYDKREFASPHQNWYDTEGKLINSIAELLFFLTEKRSASKLIYYPTSTGEFSLYTISPRFTSMNFSFFLLFAFLFSFSFDIFRKKPFSKDIFFFCLDSLNLCFSFSDEMKFSGPFTPPNYQTTSESRHIDSVLLLILLHHRRQLDLNWTFPFAASKRKKTWKFSDWKAGKLNNLVSGACDSVSD